MYKIIVHILQNRKICSYETGKLQCIFNYIRKIKFKKSSYNWSITNLYNNAKEDFYLQFEVKMHYKHYEFNYKKKNRNSTVTQ